MTANINQLTINGQQHTFLGFKNSVGYSGLYAFGTGLSDIFTQQFGAASNRFLLAANYFYFKFPSAFETMPSSTITAGAGWRFSLGLGGSGAASLSFYANSNNGTGLTSVTLNGFTGNWNNVPGAKYMFAVVNNESVVYAHFSNSTLTSLYSWGYLGWAKNGQYESPNTPRNCIQVSYDPSFSRVATENLTSASTLIVQSPAISCSIATPGANATEVICRDTASPNNYIGQLWNVIRMSSSCVLGKIYKNTGVDPDTGNVETDQKAFWLCLGNWGTDKIGMRVWTENIT